MKQQKLLAAILCAVTPLAYAATDNTLDEVVVTAKRFSENALKSASNVIVITADDIRNSPAMNLPDVLKTVAGIDVRPIYGNMGIDATVDMRGFGDTASSNTLILLDGQRLNPIDSGAISWSTIPLGHIRRIEIIPGAGAVPYGDQASSGVINIITDKSGTPQATVAATLGSYGYRGVDADGADGGEQGYFNVSMHYADSTGWRQNSHMNQQAVSGSTGLYSSTGKSFLDYALYKDASGLPGSLFSAAFSAYPTSARMPLDSQKRDGYRLRPGFAYALSGVLDLETEFSVARENSHGDYVSFSSTSDRTRDTLSLTPRLRWRHNAGQFNSETVLGADFYDGKVNAQSNGAAYLTPAVQDAAQKSTALYIQNSTDLNSNWVLRAGVRNQRMDQRASQSAYTADFGFGPTVTPAFNGDAVRSRNAYDLGLVYQADGWRAYGKIGTTFRFANTDELFATDPFTYNPVFAGDLRPQHGTIREMGASFGQDEVRGTATLYQLDMVDEIGFDGATFANTNFAPTRRSGLEAELDWRFAANLKGHFFYTYTNANFREGLYAGKEIPLVSRDKAAAQLIWLDGQLGSCSVIANYVGDRRYSGDFANALSKLPGYLTVDIQASRDMKPWTITAKLLNVFDKRYAPYGGYSTGWHDYYYYPADARSLFVNARYSFR
ncbi:MAG: TonB-dependent receptor [Nitrosomonadales bacterium]|nr:TonB-dependent receptor [Nitrosomonadales bacterium]